MSNHRPQAGHFHEVVGFAFGDAVRVDAGMARNLGHHRSRFNFRFPQWVSLREGSNTRSTRRFQRPHDTDAREHRRAVTFGNEQQRLHRYLPFFGIVFCLGQPGDVLPGVLKRDELATARQGNRIVELTLPATVVHDFALRHLYIQKLGFLCDMRMPSCTITFPSLDLDENPRIRISLV